MNKLLQYMIGAGNVSDKFLPHLPKAQVGFNGLPINMTRYSAPQDNTRRVSPQQTARDLNNAAALNKFRMEQAERKRQLALKNKGQSDLSNFFADMGTGMLSLANPLNPFADSMSPFPTQKQLEAGRSGDWMKRSGLIADATTNVVSGVLTDGLLNAAAPVIIKGAKSAGRVVGNVLRPSSLDLTNPSVLNTRLDDLYQKNNFNISFKDKAKEIVNKVVDAKLPLGPKKRILPDNMNLVSRTHRGINSPDMLRVQAVDDTGNIWGSLYARPYHNDNSDYLINGIRKSVQEVKDNSESIFRLENGLRVNDIKKAQDWLKPGMISVEPALQGNRLQDVLYEQLIRDGKIAGFKGIRSGDNLLSPAKTAKAHERFNKQIFETKNTSGVNHYVSGLTGHKNPNVIQEWLDNYQNIDKYKRNTISLRDVYNTANNAGRFVRNNPKDVSIGVGLAGATAAGAYGAIQGTNALLEYLVRQQYGDKKVNGGVITDPRGQWAHPGKVTRIPSPSITMQGVPYPVFGVGSNGQQQMMYPGQDYDFNDAQYVDEYPMMSKGGQKDQSIICSNCGWSWKESNAGSDAMNCHKCGGEATGQLMMQFGGGTLLGPMLPVISKMVPKITSIFSGDPLKKFVNWANEQDNAEAIASTSKPSSLPVKAAVRAYNWSDTHRDYRDRANKVYSELKDNDRKEYNSPKQISLSSGRFAGAKVDPEMINDIVKAAKDNNVDPWVMLSLVGRESTFGSGSLRNTFRAGNKQDLVSGWNVAEDFMPYEFNRFLADKQVPGIKVHKDNHGWSYRVEDKKVVDDYLKKNPQLIDSYYKKLESTPNLGELDSFALAAQRIKKKGIQNYNPGDPKYLSMVNSDMDLLKKDAALKEYMKSKGYKNGGQYGGKQPLEKKHNIKVTYKK